MLFQGIERVCSPSSVRCTFENELFDDRIVPSVERKNAETLSGPCSCAEKDKADTGGAGDGTLREELDGYLEQLQRKKATLMNLDPSGIHLLNQVGNAYCRHGWLRHALEAYQEALDSIICNIELYGYRGMEALLTATTQNIGVILYLQGFLKEAKETFALSLFSRQLSDKSSRRVFTRRSDVIKTISCIYDIHIERGEYAEAERIRSGMWDIRNVAHEMKTWHTQNSHVPVEDYLLGLCQKTWLLVEMCEEE